MTIRKLGTALAITFIASACTVNVDDPIDDGFADGVACAAVESHLGLATMFELPRESELDEVDLVGLCSLGAGCDPGSPLMLGSDHVFFLRAPALATDTEQAPSVVLASSADDVVSTVVEEPVCSYASGTLQALSLGSATLELEVDGVVVDRFPFVVAAPASIEMGFTALGDWEQESPVVGGEVMLTATVRDADERALVAGDAITWVLADDGVLVADGPLTGDTVSFAAVAAGTTEVIAIAGDLETSLTITVAP